MYLVLKAVISLYLLQCVSAGCDLPERSYLEVLAVAKEKPIPAEVINLNDTFYNCLSVDQLGPSSFTTLLVTLRVIFGETDFFARWALNCTDSGDWEEHNSTDYEQAYLSNLQVLFSHTFIRTDCYSCRINTSSIPTDIFGCLPCHPSCPRAGFNNSLGYCYGPSETECCAYLLNGVCTYPCPLYYVSNSSSVCVCAPNRSGANCSTCDLNCVNGVVDSGCTLCECTPDFYGTLCENQHLPCDDTPCANGGACTDGVGEGEYTCSCTNMWGDDNCTSCLTVCLNNGTGNATCNGCDCIANWGGTDCGTCQLSGCDNGGSLRSNCDGCDCIGDWGGINCGVCQLSNCQNGGVANGTCDGCDCVGNWEESDCSVCQLSNCQNGGVANGTCDGCDCIGNWGGINCDVCQLSNCQNGGVANGTCNGCHCVNSWSGADCSICQINCFNGGSSNTNCSGCDCVDYWVNSTCNTCGLVHNCTHDTVPNSNCTSCQCPFGLTGLLCETEFDFCFPSNPCGNASNCTDLAYPQTYQCECDPSYQLVSSINGPICVLVDRCASNPCNASNSLNCVNILQDYACICVPDVEGKNCSDTIDQCVPDPCVNGPCIDGNMTYTCVCPVQFEGTNCDVCTLTCSEGTLNNATCECEGTRIPCGGTTCDPFTEVCRMGICICDDPAFTPGIDDSCIDNNECLGNPCHQYAECTNTYGSYNCECKEGFEGEGFECTDLNECTLHYPACGQYPAVCEGRLGGFDCKCPSGYTTTVLTSTPYCFNSSCEPKQCIDINECLTPDICGPNQQCRNTIGGYNCECLSKHFPAAGRCEPTIGELKCGSTADGTGTGYSDSHQGASVKKQCPNTIYGQITRTCIPPCDCTADSPQWGYSDVEQCVSRELFVELNLLRRLSLEKSTELNVLESAIDVIGGLVDGNLMFGKDLELGTVFIHEVEQVIRDWPTSTVLSLSLSKYETLLQIADYLLSKSAESWEETDNSTANILSIVDTIHKICNRISTSLYDSSKSSYTFQGNSILIQLLTWDNYTTEYSRNSLQFPADSNHSLTLPYIELTRVILPGTRTPQMCKASLLLLQLKSLSSLLSTSLTGGVRRYQCINTRRQTPANIYQFIGDSISIGLMRGTCEFANFDGFANDNPIIVSLPNSPAFQEANEMFFISKLNSFNEFTQTNLAYTQACTLQLPSNGIVAFHCTSLSHYVPLLISPVEGISPSTSLILTILIKALLGLSAISCFIALLLLTFKIFELRKGLTFVRFNVILSMMFAFVIFLVGIDRTEVSWVCTIFSVLMQYFALCTTLWSLLDIINIILILTKSKIILYDVIFACVGYLLPLVPIPFSMGFSFCSYQRDRLYCWPSSETNANVQWAITAPLYLGLIALIILIVVSLFTAFGKRTEFREGSFKHFIQFLSLQLSSCTLPFLLIITWILATYSFDRDQELVGRQICFSVFAALSGVYCLLVYCIASSVKFRFSPGRGVKVMHRNEPNTNTTNVSTRARESLINPIYTEEDEMKRASSGYSKIASETMEDLEIHIQRKERFSIPSKN